MKFTPVISTWWLVGLLGPLLVLCVWQIWRRRRTPRRWAWLRRLLLIVLLAALVLRPAISQEASAQTYDNLDVYFVVDTTSSMAAEDYNGHQPRLDGAKQDITEISTALIGARFALITFAANTYVETPLTTDTAALKATVASIRQEITAYSNGSSISQPLSTLEGVMASKHKTQPNRATLIYFISDGEQTAATPIASFAPLKPFVDGGGVLGYGTTTGGQMKEYNGYVSPSSTPSYIRDLSPGASGAIAVSTINEANLQRIAAELAIPYTHRSAPGIPASVLEPSILKQLQARAPGDTTYLELYWLIAAGIVILAVLELWRAPYVRLPKEAKK